MGLETALVVDDSKLARITLQRLLERHGLKVTAAESGLQALEMLSTLHPDIIFMDHLMPELDGFETTRRIRDMDRLAAVPIIMCSGKEGGDDYHAQALSMGANDTLTKPPQPDLLQQILDRAAEAPTEALEATAQAPAQAPPRPPHVELPAAARPPQAAPMQAAPMQAAAMPDTVAEKAWVEQRLSEWQRELESCQSRVEWLEQQVRSLQNRPDMESGMLQQALEQRDQRLRELGERLNRLAERSGDHALDEADVARIVETVEQNIQSLIKGQLQQLESDVQHQMDESLSESRKDLDAHINSIESRVTERATTLAQLQSEQHLLRQDNRFDTLQSKFSDHEKTVRELSERLRESQAFCKTLQQQLNDILNREAGGNEEAPAAAPASNIGFALSSIAVILAAVALARAFGLF